MCLALLHILHIMQHHLGIFLCVPEMQLYISALTSSYFGPLLVSLSDKKDLVLHCPMQIKYWILHIEDV